jgi:hypothetical protein
VHCADTMVLTILREIDRNKASKAAPMQRCWGPHAAVFSLSPGAVSAAVPAPSMRTCRYKAHAGASMFTDTLT